MKALKKKTAKKTVTPTLLLSYTYPLNNNWSKIISTGFNHEDNFEACVILNDCMEDSIMLSTLDWYSIFVKFEKINKTIDLMISKQELTERVKQHVRVSQNLDVLIMKDHDGVVKIQLQRKDGSKSYITLLYDEYIAFYALSEFIHLVLTYNRSCTSFINMYFSSYVKKCLELNCNFLTSQHYFTPSNYSGMDSINYSRLFYELPVLCGNKIYKLISE